MIDDYHRECKMILNENKSQAMSSSRFMVNKKKHKRIIFSKFSMFENVFIGNVVTNINWVEMLLFENSVLKMYLLNSQLNLHIKSLTLIISYF